MGNKICSCESSSSTLCDHFFSKTESYNQSESSPLDKTENKQKLQLDISDMNVNPSPKYIESYNSIDIILIKNKSSIIIQRNVKYYLHKKTKLKTQKIKGSILNQDYSSITLKTLQTSDTAPKLQVENEAFQPLPDIVEHSSPRRLHQKQSMVSTKSSSSSIKNGDLNNKSKLKGYFLRKNKKYKYIGNLKKEKKDDFGIVTWEDGSKFFAKFEDNNSKGICKYIDATQTKFYGIYVNNRPAGYGLYEEQDSSYEGMWSNNILNGVGIEIWKEDGSFYRGCFHNSMKEGIGLHRCADGTIYQGEWSNNKMNGLGIIYFNNEQVYSGEIKDGVIDGFGEFAWPDGKRYIGQYNEEKKDGFGIFAWSKDPIVAYVGFWSKGKQHGFGMSIHNDKAYYNIWKNGKKDTAIKNNLEINHYMKSSSLRHWKFLTQDPKMIIQYVHKLLNENY